MVLQPVVRSFHFLLALDWRLRCDTSLFDEVSHGVNSFLALDDFLKECLFVFKVARVKLLLQAGEDMGRRAVECTIGIRQRRWLWFVFQERLFT